jgi:hypothetical protein
MLRRQACCPGRSPESKLGDPRTCSIAVASVQWDDKHMEYNFDVRTGPINVSWFKGGTTNLCYNCLDRNIEKGLGDSVCFIWEGNEPGVPPVHV